MLAHATGIFKTRIGINLVLQNKSYNIEFREVINSKPDYIAPSRATAFTDILEILVGKSALMGLGFC